VKVLSVINGQYFLAGLAFTNQPFPTGRVIAALDASNDAGQNHVAFTIQSGGVTTTAKEQPSQFASATRVDVDLYGMVVDVHYAAVVNVVP
jgi:hypothetical protein